jgi:hypothetical protein
MEPVLPAEYDQEVRTLRAHLPHLPRVPGSLSFCEECGWSWSEAALHSGRVVSGCRSRRAALQVLEDCDVLPESVVIR